MNSDDFDPGRLTIRITDRSGILRNSPAEEDRLLLAAIVSLARSPRKRHPVLEMLDTVVQKWQVTE